MSVNESKYCLMKPYIFAVSFILATGCASTHGALGTWQAWPTEAQVTAETRGIFDEMAAGRLESAAAMSMHAMEPQDLYLRAEISAFQGNLPQAVDRFADLVARYPDSAFVSAAVARMLMLTDATATPLDWTKVAALRTNDPYALARLVVLQNKAMRGQPNQADLVHPMAMPLARWRWVGPFTPHVRTGFAAVQPFEADESLANQYEVQGQTLTAFAYPVENQTVMAAVKAGVYAGETVIRAEKATEALLVVQSAQLYDLTIDGMPVMRRDVADFGQNTILAVPVELPAGEHRVRMKLGLSSSKNTPIRVWMVPTGESRLSDMIEMAGMESAPKKGLKVGKRIDIAHVLGSVISPVPDDAMRVWLGAMQAIADGKVQIADALIQARLAKNPDDVMAKYWRAMRYRLDADLDPDIRSEKVIQTLREISEAAPEMAYAHLTLMREFLKQNQPKQAFEIWNQWRSHIPENSDTALVLSEMTKALDWSEISEQYALDAARMTPDSCRLGAAALAIEHRKHQYTSYDAMSERLQMCPSVIYTWAKLEADDAADADRWNQAIAKLSADYPNDVRLHLMTIQQRVNEDPAGAVQAMNAHLDAVESGYYPALATDVALEFIDRLRAKNLHDEANQILNRMLELYPADETLQNLSLQIQNVRPFEDLRIDGMKVIQEYLAQNRSDAGSSVMILDYAATRMMPNGAKLGITHQISRVLSKEGKNEVGEIYLPRAASVLKIRTIKDGTFEVVEPESIDFKASITAPNLAIGDYVEVEYVTFEPPASAYTNRVVSDAFFYGSDTSPLVKSAYVYEYPKDWKIDVIESGPQGQIQTNCVPNGAYTRCTASRTDIPVLITEPRSPSGFDIIPNIQVYHRYDWDVVRTGLFESITRQTRITPYVERFFAGIGIPENESVYAYARAIYDTVVQSIDESESVTNSDAESATRSVSKGVGSRIITLKAMYDLAGIPSFFALVRSAIAPENAEKLPSYYNNAYATMLVVETEKGLAYVQPSEDFVPFDYLGLDFNAQQAIPIDMNREIYTTRRDDLETMRANIDIEYQIAEDGSASAKSTEIMRGTRALIMRNFLTTLKNDDQKAQQVIQNSLANSYGRIELKRLENENLEDKNSPLTMYYDFDIASFAAPSDGQIEILSRIFAYHLVKQYAPLPPEERKFDVLIDSDIVSERTLTFHAPAGYTWQTDTLQDVSIDTPFGKFSRKMTLQGSDLQLSESITILPQRVKSSQYADFRAFCLAVDEAQRTVMVMKK